MVEVTGNFLLESSESIASSGIRNHRAGTLRIRRKPAKTLEPGSVIHWSTQRGRVSTYLFSPSPFIAAENVALVGNDGGEYVPPGKACGRIPQELGPRVNHFDAIDKILE